MGRRMTDTAQRDSGNTRVVLLAVLAAGFLFRFLPLLFWHSIAQADEIFQAGKGMHAFIGADRHEMIDVGQLCIRTGG